MGIKLDKDPLAVEKKNYAIKIVNAYLVYVIDTLLQIALSNFKLKNVCLVRLIS